MKFKVSLVTILICLVSLGCDRNKTQTQSENEETKLKTKTVVVDTQMRVQMQPKSNSSVEGYITFLKDSDKITVSGQIKNLPSKVHAIHIHQYGDCSTEDASSAGDHFNPTNVAHGSPSDPQHHVGDLGNIEVSEGGTASFKMEFEASSLNEYFQSISGRAVVIHSGEDDFKTQPSGDAGDRIACGVIGVMEASENVKL